MILLDTHVWIWAADVPEKLSEEQRRVIDTADVVLISAVSFWEIGLLARKDKVDFGASFDDWLARASELVRVVPLTAEIALASTQLPGGFHADPADRFLVATARDFDCLLVTSNGKILDYSHVLTIG